VAVIKVNAANLPTIPFGDSRQLEVGDVVLAIGYPANMAQSVTSGIVGGLHRTNIGIEQHENFIQTDAAVYPGNSGGALVDVRGDLVGINTAFIGSTSTNPGVGFAIPVNLARIIAEQLLKHGDIRRGTLGLTIDDPTAAVLRDLNLTSPQRGAVITKVAPGSAGERAGLKAGDVVARVGEAAARDAAFVRTRIALLRIGETAELAVWRDGKEMTVRATVTERQPQAAAR
jgi:S1-C subfamily serine protease